MKSFKQITYKIPYQPKLPGVKKSNTGWWTPIWKGLATDTDGKHRQAMGLSIWIYLYLLTHTNRQTGIVRKKQETIAKETGVPLRTVQRHLKRLISQKYITILSSEKYQQIRIEKWKLFNHKQFDDK